MKAVKIIAGISAVQLLDHDAKEEDFDDHSYGSVDGRRRTFGIGTPRVMKNESEVDFREEHMRSNLSVDMSTIAWEIYFNILENLWKFMDIFLHTLMQGVFSKFYSLMVLQWFEVITTFGEDL